MRNRLLLILIVLLTGSCTSDFETEVQPPHTLSEAEEMNVWIYKQMSHYYLWNEEMPDSIDCNFQQTPREFFKSILSPKDRFSYLTNSSRSSEDIGFAYQAFEKPDGEIIYQVLYVTSPGAKSQGLRRGDFVKILSHSGNHVMAEIITLSSYRDSRSEISYEVNPDIDQENTVLLDTVYSISDKRIGYLCYLEFGEPKDFYEAFKSFKEHNIEELILDLRYNPGGLVTTCKKLCSLIVSSNAYGAIFQQYSYNDIISAENQNVYGDPYTYTYFETPNLSNKPILGLRYDFLDLPNVYVLTSSHTASASEATINGLSPYMNVTTIGAVTRGKGVGMTTISSSKFRYSLVPITFRYYNSLGETVPDSGIVPDFLMEDTYYTPKYEIGDISEPLLAKAIDLIVPGFKRTKSRSAISDFPSLTPVGEPSYVIEFNNKQYNESN